MRPSPSFYYIEQAEIIIQRKKPEQLRRDKIQRLISCILGCHFVVRKVVFNKA